MTDFTQLPKLSHLPYLHKEVDSSSQTPNDQAIGDLPQLPKTTGDVNLLNETDEDDDCQNSQNASRGGKEETFDDWFESDLHSDSAEEEFEENIVIVDPTEEDDIESHGNENLI